ncbi:immunity 26/phosphotriesterase HocA family protein [Shewanella chilikensis]|uniref:Imm26 family immunity protein n=1 Tax=Shewanella chilikensis TaxID=558541 RepID=UPI00200BB547|nr:Imm26 family immunity protein [Shewanella chilikensis]MCL1164428.1 immunity 26/phosphotriesterase HocA family protein [Shewanella chilikensis]
MILNSGDVFSIPLFLNDVSAIKNFSRFDFSKEGMEFYFARIIEDRGGSGILMEVFDFCSRLDSQVADIISRPRLFDPVAVAGEGIKKKRWRFIGTTDYDKEKYSNYSKISFLMGPRESRYLWKGGQEYPLKDTELTSVEEYIIWPAVQIERRIVNELNRKRGLVHPEFR